MLISSLIQECIDIYKHNNTYLNKLTQIIYAQNNLVTY